MNLPNMLVLFFFFIMIPCNLCADTDSVVAYYINLDRSAARRESIEHLIQQLPIVSERISAVDGRNLDRQQLINTHSLDESLFLQRIGRIPDLGTIGCYLSHLKAWNNFLNSSYKFALIFEDDVTFQAQKLIRIVNSLIDHQESWDLVNLEPSHAGCPLPIKELNTYGTQLVIYAFRTAHTGCYLINRYAVIQLIRNALPISMPIDHYITRNWESKIKYRGVEPRFVHQSFSESTIQSMVKKIDAKKSYFYRLNSIYFKAKSALFRYFHSLYEFLINI